MFSLFSFLSLIVATFGHGWHYHNPPTAVSGCPPGSPVSISQNNRFRLEQTLWRVSFIADDLTLGIGFSVAESQAFLDEVLADSFSYQRLDIGITDMNKTSFIALLTTQLPFFFRGWHYLVGTPPLYECASNRFVRIRINDFVVSPQFTSGDQCRQDMTGEAIYWELRKIGGKWKVTKIENNVADEMNPIESNFTCPAPNPPVSAHSGPLTFAVDGASDLSQTIIEKVSTVGESNSNLLIYGMFLVNVIFCSIVLCKMFCYSSHSSKKSSNLYGKISTVSSESELE